eukprot:scaffold13213_cov160-Skeletonema_menzelii.AAC.2
MQHERMHKSSCQRRSVQEAWCAQNGGVLIDMVRSANVAVVKDAQINLRRGRKQTLRGGKSTCWAWVTPRNLRLSPTSQPDGQPDYFSNYLSGQR